MIHAVSYLMALTAGLASSMVGGGPVAVILSASAAAVLTLVGFGVAFRRAMVRNTLQMIEAEWLFHEHRVAEAINFEARRARRAAWWDRFAPKLSLALPVYVSLVTKCLATRRVEEAQRWITRMEGYAGDRARRLTHYFRVVATSLLGDPVSIARAARELRAALDPDKAEDRSYLAQLAFIEAKWALRLWDLGAAEKHLREAHDLQPELDLYYAIRSNLALASGNLPEAQDYAHSMATGRLRSKPPAALVALEQLVPVLERDLPKYGAHLERLQGTLGAERARFMAQGLYPQAEVAVASRDATLLEETVRQIEETGCRHPGTQARLHAAASLVFAWRGDFERVRAMAPESLRQLDHAACGDDDVGAACLWLALACAEAGATDLTADALRRGQGVPQFRANRLAQHVRALAESLVAWRDKATTPTRRAEAADELRSLQSAPEAPLFDPYHALLAAEIDSSHGAGGAADR